MAVGEGDDDAVGGQVPEPRDRVRGETRLGLLAVGHDRRSGFLQAADGVAHGVVLRRGEVGVGYFPSLPGGHCGQQFPGAGEAADRFGPNHNASLDNAPQTINR